MENVIFKCACCRLLGSYGAIKSSRLEDILVDLTGGVVQQIHLKSSTSDGIGARIASGVGRDEPELLQCALRRGALVVAHPSAVYLLHKPLTL